VAAAALHGTQSVVFCCAPARLEAVLYSLTANSRQLLMLRQPALADLHIACTWASHACSKAARR
jgi:hypothetical protein